MTKRHPKKRRLFDELMEGLESLKAHREGRITLRTHVVEYSPVPELKPKEVLQVRERANMSRPVFASRLRTNVRTLENWEQGRAKPNAQAALLIRLVEKYPDTIEKLAKV